MSTVEEIERVIKQLPPKEFEKLAAWIDQRRESRSVAQAVRVETTDASNTHPKADRSTDRPVIHRDHSAFLNSYAPADEGLYDDAATR